MKNIKSIPIAFLAISLITGCDKHDNSAASTSSNNEVVAHKHADEKSLMSHIRDVYKRGGFSDPNIIIDQTNPLYGHGWLHQAAEKNWLDVAKYLLEKGHKPDGMDLTGSTSLHIAVVRNNIELAELLIKYGANVNASNKSNRTPLQLAKEKGCSQLVKLLTENGASEEGDPFDESKYSFLMIHLSSPSQLQRVPVTPIHHAIREGDILLAKSFIDRGADINGRDAKGNTPLHSSVDGIAKLDLSKALIAAGAQINARNNTGVTPIHWAAQHNNTDAAKLLISEGVDLNLADNYGRTCLHTAVRNDDSEMVELLLSSRVDVNPMAENNTTPLHGAAFANYIDLTKLILAKTELLEVARPDITYEISDKEAGILQYAKESFVSNPEIEMMLGLEYKPILHYAVDKGWCYLTEYLVDRGQDVNGKHMGESPLHLAMRQGNSDLIKLLLVAGANMYSRDKNGASSLDRVDEMGNERIKNLFKERREKLDINLRGKEGYTALHFACQQGHVDLAKLLIAHGAKLETRNSKLMTPLHLAAQNGHSSIAEMLLSKGAEINAKTLKDVTALHLAAREGHRNVVAALLAAEGPDILEDDSTGHDAILAILYAIEKGDASIVELLLKHKTAQKLKKEAMVDILLIASLKENTEVPRLLKEYGAKGDINVAVAENDNKAVNIMLRSGIDINNTCSAGWTPLYTAVRKKNYELAQFLIAKGADVNAQPTTGDTPLHRAVLDGNVMLAKLLLENDASVNETNTENNTPLHIAAKYGHIDLVKLLLKHEADVTVRGGRANTTALSMAKIREHNEIVKLLEKHAIQ